MTFKCKHGQMKYQNSTSSYFRPILKLKQEACSGEHIEQQHSINVSETKNTSLTNILMIIPCHILQYV